ncbi:MAG: hypothetical protein Q4E05_11025 [Pseudoclavibacter sp.]|nr:hypothetical protein [Pseudoclavibacter sp.]
MKKKKNAAAEEPLQDARTVILHVKWARMAEPIGWMIDSVDTFTEKLTRSSWEFTGWSVDGFGPWREKDRRQKATDIRRFTSMDPGHNRAEGYRFALTGRSEEHTLTLHLSAGSLYVPTRGPRSRARITLHSHQATRRVPSHMCDWILEESIGIWNPLEVNVTTRALNVASREFDEQTGRIPPDWSIGIGHRIWLADEVGPADSEVKGVGSRPLAGGTLFFTAHHWPSSRVVEAMRAALDANNLHQLPHTPGRYQGPPPD